MVGEIMYLEIAKSLGEAEYDDLNLVLNGD